MATKFRKQMLHVGKYRSPDGEVEVTSDRLRHWSREFGRMTENRQAIPMHWDHSNNVDDLTPIAMDLFERRERSAKNAVGRMTGFEVSDDGNSASISFEVTDPAAASKFATNTIQVSPVFFSSWADGGGNCYSDCITHLDAVVHPVDHSQSPAERVDAICCAIRFGMDAKPMEKASYDSDDTDEPDTMATVGKVLEELKKVDIVLPADTNGKNFIDRLYTALLTAVATQGPDMTNPQPSDDKTVVDPKIATMSLEAKKALAYGERTHRNAVQSQLDELLKTGRCTPAEHTAQAEGIKAIKLSLNDQGEPEKSGLEAWIDSRKAVPEGTFWSPEQKLSRMSVAEHPGPIDVSDSGDTVDPDKAADFVLGTR